MFSNLRCRIYFDQSKNVQNRERKSTYQVKPVAYQPNPLAYQPNPLAYQLVMRSSIRSENCYDSKSCTCVICFIKYVHRIWFASQPRLNEMSAPKDKEMFTKSLADKYAASEEEASACRDKFMSVHRIVRKYKTKQKRHEWSLTCFRYVASGRSVPACDNPCTR